MISFSPFLLLCDEQMDCSVSGLVELLEPTPHNSGQEMRKKKKGGGGGANERDSNPDACIK